MLYFSTCRSSFHMLGFACSPNSKPRPFLTPSRQLTNPEHEAAKIAELRKRQGMNAQVIASVNKERLATLLGEVQNKDTSQERYRQSLEYVFCIICILPYLPTQYIAVCVQRGTTSMLSPYRAT
eukprot:8328389-Pyramimonas_sp.AAC.2